MGSGRPLTCHRSESSASGSATMNSAEDPLCGMTSGAGKFRASARAGTRVRMRCATRAIPRRSVLNIQMLRLWDDRLHFVISPVIIVSGPLSPLFQLTTATSVTSTRAPSLSRFSCLSFRTSYRYGSPWSVMARRRSHRSIIGSIQNHPTSSPARHHRCL